jgi:hypothetical protein
MNSKKDDLVVMVADIENSCWKTECNFKTHVAYVFFKKPLTVSVEENY